MRKALQSLIASAMVRGSVEIEMRWRWFLMLRVVVQCWVPVPQLYDRHAYTAVRPR